VTLELMEFLRTGDLGDLAWGAGRAQVAARCGEPQATAHAFRKDKHLTILLYGNVELYVAPESDLLYAFHWDAPEAPRGGSGLHVNAGPLRPGLSPEGIASALTEAGISWEEVTDLTTGLPRWTTQGGAILGFDDGGGLVFVSRWRDELLPAPTPTRNVSMTLDEVLVERLKAEARRRGVSLARLCAGIIEGAVRDLP
jgi:hypothetical protein